jgi:hypothetical protein
MPSRQVRKACNILIYYILILTYLSPPMAWLNVAPYHSVMTGCQDVIGSIPSVFLDKNKFLKELAANVRDKFFIFQTFFNKCF